MVRYPLGRDLLTSRSVRKEGKEELRKHAFRKLFPFSSLLIDRDRRVNVADTTETCSASHHSGTTSTEITGSRQTTERDLWNDLQPRITTHWFKDPQGEVEGSCHAEVLRQEVHWMEGTRSGSSRSTTQRHLRGHEVSISSHA